MFLCNGMLFNALRLRNFIVHSEIQQKKVRPHSPGNVAPIAHYSASCSLCLSFSVSLFLHLWQFDGCAIMQIMHLSYCARVRNYVYVCMRACVRVYAFARVCRGCYEGMYGCGRARATIMCVRVCVRACLCVRVCGMYCLTCDLYLCI